ncbi:MAG TPA: hypothetical protein ENI95_02080 [Chloroflexi bacterium]|nr:hypothetical protein [Chloroflexota bacterium]
MRFRRLIERKRAANYIFTLLLAFVATILLTRLFLSLTGYPQIGNERLHIAHVLWGGLIVAVGAALPLIFSNTFILEVSALLSGIGLGLFFDEVGKFLTQDNDYFFRPAASVIYVLFLLGVYIYVSVRRGEPDPQTRLYHALAAMQEIVDGDLDVREKEELEELLNSIIGEETDIPDVRELAKELLEFVQHQADAVPVRSSPLEESIRRAVRWVDSHLLTPTATRWLLIGSTAFLTLLALLDIVELLHAIGHPDEISRFVQEWIVEVSLTSAQETVWFVVMLSLKSIVGLALLIALALFAFRRDEAAISFALGGLLLSITLVNVLLFYFKQFTASVYAMADFTLIAGLNFYKRRYLQTGHRPARRSPPKK